MKLFSIRLKYLALLLFCGRTDTRKRRQVGRRFGGPAD